MIVDNAVVLLVPVAELGVARPSYRVTASRHRGDYDIPAPHEWSGDVEPPVAAGLAAFLP